MSTKISDDGLGAGITAQVEQEEVIDEPVRPSGGLTGDDGEQRTEPPAPAAGEDAAWMASLDEETREYVRSKGWKGPADVARSARESETSLRREQAERDRLSRENTELQQWLQQGPGQQQNQDEDPFNLQQIGEALEAGQITYADYTKILMHEIVPRIAMAVSEQQVKPLALHQKTGQLQETANELAETYPDFWDLSNEVLDLIRQNPGRYDDPDGMRSAYGLVKAKRDAQAAVERRRTARAETMNSGSLGVASKSAEAAIIEAMEKAVPRVDDGL